MRVRPESATAGAVTGSPLIGVVGNLCNLGYEFARGFSSLGVPTRLIIAREGLAEWQRWAGPVRKPEDDVLLDVVEGTRLRRELNMLQALRRYDVLLSICLGGFHVLPFARRPYLSYATGSDLRELALGTGPYKSVDIAFARRTFRGARVVFYSPDRGHMAAIDELGLRSTVPWRQIVDVDFWRSEPSRSDDLIVFTPTSQHWKPAFAGQALKRNDVFIRGLARFINAGGSATLRYLRRGPDVDATEALIRELNLDRYAEPVGGNLSPIELRTHMGAANVVADQFSLGMLGLVALEAMAAGRAVITYLDEDLVKFTYPERGDRPPLLSVRTASDVEAALWRLSDPGIRAADGMAAAAWVNRVHDPLRLFDWYLSYIKP